MLVAFIVLSVFFNGSWTAMFSNKVYMQVFLGWPFFRVMTISGAIVTFATTASAIWCRIGFGRGLAEKRMYLLTVLTLHFMTNYYS